MTAKQQPIHFHFADVRFYFPQRTRTKEMISTLIEKEGKRVDIINYIFCSDAYLLALNKSYLHHDTLTDIITFHYHTPKNPIQSDVYISVERVRENARLFKVSFRHELHRVLFHGALHLCGYKDKKKEEQARMRGMEDHYLQRLLVSRETEQ